MNLAALSENDLRIETQNCAQREKRETALLISHLIEVEKRELHLKWGHGSLFAYLTDELDYEKGAASLRVSAVRAAETVHDLPQKIETGELSLKTIRTVESFAYHEAQSRGQALTKTEKKEIYNQVATLSVTQAETVLANIATSEKFAPPAKDFDRAIKGSKRLIQFVVTEEEYEILQQGREVLSHRHPGASVGDLYKLAMQDLVRRRHPKHKAERNASREKLNANAMSPHPAGKVGFDSAVVANQTGEAEIDTAVVAHPVGKAEADKAAADRVETSKAAVAHPAGEKRSRYIAAKESHALWREYDGKGCVYVEPKSGKRCGSKHRLQRDHRHSFALGGANTKDNLQLFCRQHNALKARLELDLWPRRADQTPMR